MTKKEQFIQKLRPLLHDRRTLEAFLLEESNLPGPRANLELLWAIADVYDNLDVLKAWSRISPDQAGANDPQCFLVCCAAVCYGKTFIHSNDDTLIAVLKKMANDNRWRVRESVAFAFQFIGEKSFNTLKSIFIVWIPSAQNLEKRVMLVALAHPPFLDVETAAFCFDMLEPVFASLDPSSEHFEVLRKSLEFVISVYSAAHPVRGFAFMEKQIGSDKMRNRIIKANLKKNRLHKHFPHETGRLLQKLS